MPAARLRPIWLPIDRAALLVAASMRSSLLRLLRRGRAFGAGRGAAHLLLRLLQLRCLRGLALGFGRGVCRARREHLVGGLAVDDRLVVPGEQRASDDRRRCSGVMAPIWLRGGQDQGALDDRRAALLVEQRDQRLADAELA